MSEAFTDQLQYLAACEPWALEQMERFVWLLAGRRQLERFALLGCWVLSPERFVCVLSHPRLGNVGITVNPEPAPAEPPFASPAADGWDRAVRRAAELVALLDADQVEQWRAAGWIHAQVVWNDDPSDIVTPWGPSGPPAVGDPLLDPEAKLQTSVTAPSDHLEPMVAAVQDLHGWVEHPMSVSTAMARLITNVTPRAPLRFAALWAVAPDTSVSIEAHIVNREPSQFDAELDAGYRLPGQQYLRVGDIYRSLVLLDHGLTWSRYWEVPSGRSNEQYPAGYAEVMMRARVIRNGVGWWWGILPDDCPPLEKLPDLRVARCVDQAPLDAMADLLHLVLDTSACPSDEAAATDQTPGASPP